MDNCHLLAVMLLATVGTAAGSTTTQDPIQDLSETFTGLLDEFQNRTRDQDVDGLVSLFSENPIIIDQRVAIAIGTDGIEEYFRAAFDKGRGQDPNLTHVFTHSDLIGPHGDYAVDILEVHVTKFGLPLRERRQMIGWQQNNDDEWKQDWVFSNTA